MKPWELFNKLRAVPYRRTGKDLDWYVDIDHKERKIRTMFQESASPLDWFLNFVFLIIPAVIGGTPYWFTLGWWLSWCSCKELVMNKIMTAMNEYPDYEVESCGYSYGGAEAVLCGIEIYERTGVKPYLTTFGAPKPLFSYITVLLARRCFKEVNQYAHWNDIVTWCIPLPGYWTIKNIRLGKFSLKDLFNPVVYHQIYGDESIYGGR